MYFLAHSVMGSGGKYFCGYYKIAQQIFFFILKKWSGGNNKKYWELRA